MPKNNIARKASRIVGMAAILGTTAALILVGGPADAGTMSAARGVVITMARGV